MVGFEYTTLFVLVAVGYICVNLKIVLLVGDTKSGSLGHFREIL